MTGFEHDVLGFMLEYLQEQISILSDIVNIPDESDEKNNQYLAQVFIVDSIKDKIAGYVDLICGW